MAKEKHRVSEELLKGLLYPEFEEALRALSLLGVRRVSDTRDVFPFPYASFLWAEWGFPGCVTVSAQRESQRDRDKNVICMKPDEDGRVDACAIRMYAIHSQVMSRFNNQPKVRSQEGKLLRDSFYFSNDSNSSWDFHKLAFVDRKEAETKKPWLFRTAKEIELLHEMVAPIFCLGLTVVFFCREGAEEVQAGAFPSLDQGWGMVVADVEKVSQMKVGVP